MVSSPRDVHLLTEEQSSPRYVLSSTREKRLIASLCTVLNPGIDTSRRSHPSCSRTVRPSEEDTEGHHLG